MSTKSDDPAIAAWKRLLDMPVSIVAAMTEGSRKMHETQLKAAIETHGAAEATHRKLAEAADGQELWRIESEWLSANAEKSLAYWRELQQVALETQTSIARCLSTPLLGDGAGAVPEGPLEMMNGAYKRWLEASRQLYALPAPRTE